MNAMNSDIKLSACYLLLACGSVGACLTACTSVALNICVCFCHSLFVCLFLFLFYLHDWMPLPSGDFLVCLVLWNLQWQTPARGANGG